MNYNNTSNIPLSLAVWLANDTYDHSPDPKYISVTSLLKPLRSIILTRSMPIDRDIDLADLVASKLGTAVHESIEQSWSSNYRKVLEKLGYPKKITEGIIINPTNPDALPEEAIPVYMEIRSLKEVGDYVIGGKFDFVIEGKLEDFKTTRVYNWITQSNAEDYTLQGSMYRWLNPDIITKDTIGVDYIFTDWKQLEAIKDKSYPQKKVIQQNYVLASIADTQKWVEDRLYAIDQFKDAPQNAIPKCTKKELWQNDSVFKYYKDPSKRQRSTKNFTNLAEANVRLAKEGVGIVLEVPGEAKRCLYCNAISICQQAEQLKLEGLLKI